MGSGCRHWQESTGSGPVGGRVSGRMVGQSEEGGAVG